MSPEPPARTNAKPGTAWTGASPEEISWLWSASTGSVGGGWTPFNASSPCGLQGSEDQVPRRDGGLDSVSGTGARRPPRLRWPPDGQRWRRGWRTRSGKWDAGAPGKGMAAARDPGQDPGTPACPSATNRCSLRRRMKESRSLRTQDRPGPGGRREDGAERPEVGSTAALIIRKEDMRCHSNRPQSPRISRRSA